MKNFGLIGASGYIAPKHMRAIQETNNNLKCFLDPHDNVGYIDRFFPDAKYFRETERFERHLDRLKRKNEQIDYVSVCSPNYLHDSHIRLALRNGCDVICEKPLVINYDHLQSLQEIEKETGKKIYNILQLRHHPTIQDLKLKVEKNKKYDVELKYITPRGSWYDFSWKGEKDKSGGVLFNIGVHFFDMLIWIFGKPLDYNVTNLDRKSYGILNLENATVKFELSIDKNDLPWNEWKPFRSIKIDGKEIEFSEGFTDLHTVSYQNILNERGFGIEDVKETIKLISILKNK